MKDYTKFINEARLKGSKAVSDETLSDIEKKAEKDLKIKIDDPVQKSHVSSKLMELINQSRTLVFSGRSKSESDKISKELVELAKNVILDEYGDILDNVDLDIRLVPFGSVANEMPDIKDVPDSPPDKADQEKLVKDILDKEDDVVDEDPKSETPKGADATQDAFFASLFAAVPEKPKKKSFTKTEEYKLKVDKAKLINAITQGEAKNTKHILHSDKVKAGLKEIFGDKWERIFKIWDETSKTADQLDWLIPIGIKADMMRDVMGGMAGAVQVSWDEAKDSHGDDSEESENFNKSAEDILKDIEEGGDLDSNREEIEELFSNGNPKITAIGVDFPMLLHETVKGIYQLIGSAYLPAADAGELEIAKAEVVKSATSSFEDEAEDFRYGPYIASTLRDFINSCEGSDRYPNMREYVFGDMVLLPEGEFLDLMKGILEGNESTKKKIEEIISDIIDRIREYEVSLIDEPDYGFESDSDEDDFYPVEDDSIEADSVEDDVIDYSKMTKRQLDDAMNLALDSGDVDALRIISKELESRNESVMLSVYRNDINRILKS
jgi:hypothetical protein